MPFFFKRRIQASGGLAIISAGFMFLICLDFHCTLMMFFARVIFLFFHQCKIED